MIFTDGKPTIVSEMIAKSAGHDELFKHDLYDPAMDFAAWRTLKTLREQIEAKPQMTREEILGVVCTLEGTYEALYLMGQ